MITVKDEIENFIPAQKPRLVILGTMGSAVARTLNGNKPEDAFFYHDTRNQFWNIIQLLFEPNLKPKKMSVKEKREFLNRRHVAIANIVHEIEVEEGKSKSSADSILFSAHKEGRLKFKKISSELKIILETTPLFFTRKFKKEIKGLVDGYMKFNKIDTSVSEKILYLPSPTRCNPHDRSVEWKKAMKVLT